MPARPALLDEAAQLLGGLRQTGMDATGLARMLAGVIAAQPGHGAARVARASCLWEAGAMAEAIAEFRAAMALRPEEPGLARLLGIALVQAGALAEGEALLAGVTAREPADAEALALRSHALGRLMRHEAAIAMLRAALRLRPDVAQWHALLAGSLLAAGQLDEGWAEYAWRWRWPEAARMAPRVPADPLRRPDPGAWAGRRVVLFAEQGHGDTLQCLRYAAAAVATGAEVILEVQPALLRLARSVPGVADVVPWGAAPAHDIAVPMFHLPWAFATDLATIPATVPYLRADPAMAAGWRRRLAALPGLKVGLVWSGDPRPHQPEAQAVDARRSLALAALAPLAGIAGVVFVSLQKGAGAAQAAEPPAGMVLHDWTGELTDFADTAALMAALDLVVTVDSAPVHLAGALGRPVWMLNRFDSCWRWLVGRDDSPWYPTLRQFRQEEAGAWGPVVARLAAALSRAAARAPAPGTSPPPP